MNNFLHKRIERKTMGHNLIKQILKWLKNDFLPLLFVGSLMTLSMMFVYHFVVGTVIILLGGHHLFAFVVWLFIITSLIYFLALFLTQMWEYETIEIIDKIRPTIVYIGLMALITYAAVNKGYIIALFIIYIFAIIGSITGHYLNRNNGEK